MIELHCHLDGSLTVEDALTLSKMTGETLPTTDKRELFSLLTYSGVGTLNDYLKKFDLPIRLLQNAEAVEYAVTSVAERLSSIGISYAEIRFAPALHTARGATMKEIIQGAIKGCKQAAIPISLLLCAMRGREEKENLHVIELAAEEKDSGVVGVDLAGAEAIYPTEGYRNVFRLASRLGLNITIHAGEAAGADSVRAALDFGAKRIGHGVSAAEDKALLDRIKRENVAIEVCPTSNVQTGKVASVAESPIGVFLERGIACAICSDNMTVSNTDAVKEVALVKQSFPHLKRQIEESILSAEKYTFGKVVR